MMTAAIYGRLGQDPKTLETNSGKLMVVASMAVSLKMRIVSAKSVRPGGRKPEGQQKEPDFDDEVAF